MECLTVVQSAASSSGLTALRQGEPPDTIGASLHLSEEPHFRRFPRARSRPAFFDFCLHLFTYCS